MTNHLPLLRKAFVYSLFAALSFGLKAQVTEPVNSTIALLRCINMADSGQYDKAIEMCEKINRNDSNYVFALLEDATCRQLNGQDSMAVVLCQKGLAEHSAYRPSFYSLMGNAMIDLNNDDAAIKILKDSAITQYPTSFKLYATIGLAYYKSLNYDSAISYLEKAINMNIFDATSHYYLGRCCLEQGRMIPAILSLQYYLLLDPYRSRSFATIQLLEQVEQNKYEYNKATAVDPDKYKDGDFSDLELLIKSQVALKEDYKSKVHFVVTKQAQLLFEKLTYTPNTGNYWMETYVPYYIALFKKDYTEAYCCHFMQRVNDADLQKQISKDKRKIDEFLKWTEDYIEDKRKNRELPINGVMTKVACYYFSNHMLDSYGKENSSKKSIGQWTHYNKDNGAISSQGSYNDNGDMTGIWQWYFFDGKMWEKDNYKNGKRDGESDVWYRNGAQKGIYNYAADKMSGDAKSFTSSGTPSSSGTYKDDNIVGTYNTYYPDGKIKFVLHFNDKGKKDGEQKEYYATGEPELVTTYSNGVREGQCTEYFQNGKIKSQGTYKGDVASGYWKIYFEDGTLKKEGGYNDGEKLMGKWKIYNRKSVVIEEINYTDGKINGLDIDYNSDGVKYQEAEYKNGTMIRNTCFDASGKAIHEDKISSRSDSLHYYYYNGVVQSAGRLTNNEKNGLWKFYSLHGVLTKAVNYTKGQIDGANMEYYSNGQVEDSLNWDNGTRAGLYVDYYMNGQKKSEGWYVNDDREGDWMFYYENGVKQSQFYYHLGTEEGYATFYDVYGRASETNFREFGYLDKIAFYDSTGTKSTFNYKSNTGNGDYQPHYANGQTRIARTYMAGETEGPQTFYYINGKPSGTGSYMNGNREGKYTYYYDNGNVESENSYSEGNLEGPVKKYYNTGKLKIEENYLGDDKDGLFKEYYKNGHTMITGSYLNGSAEGEFRYYSEDSALYCVRYYHKGTCTGYSYAGKDGNLVPVIQSPDNGTYTITCYYANGTKSFVANMLNGSFNGKVTYYNPKGVLTADENYAYGEFSGSQKYYYGTGKLKAEEVYDKWGNKDGVCTYYNEDGSLEHTEKYIIGNQYGPEKYYNKAGQVTKTTWYYNDSEIAQALGAAATKTTTPTKTTKAPAKAPVRSATPVKAAVKAPVKTTK